MIFDVIDMETMKYTNMHVHSKGLIVLFHERDTKETTRNNCFAQDHFLVF